MRLTLLGGTGTHALGGVGGSHWRWSHTVRQRQKVREAPLKWTPVLAREARRGSTKSCHCRPQGSPHSQTESPVTGPRRKWCALHGLPNTDYPCNPATENSLLSWNKPILVDQITSIFKVNKEKQGTYSLMMSLGCCHWDLRLCFPMDVTLWFHTWQQL